MTPGARKLHRFLMRASLSLGGVFAWVFIFQYFYVLQGSLARGLVSVLLTYALAQLVTVLLTPWCAGRIRFGLRRMLVYSILLLGAAFAVLAASFASYLGNLGWGIGLFAVLMGAHRALYWMPYELSREKEPARVRYGSELLIALIPLLGGLALTSSPIAPVPLLGVAAYIAFLSLIPLWRMQERYEGFAWGYRRTFHELFAPGFARITYSALLQGIEGAALLLLWPLLIFMLLQWSYPMLGVVLTATFILTLLLRRILARPLARLSTPLSALLVASAWLMRLGVGGAVGVVLVDTYSYVGSRRNSRSLDVHAFEQSADNTTYVDEYTALKEMGLAIGRALLCGLAAVLLSIFSVAFSFVLVFMLVAICAAASVYLSRS